MSQIIPYLILLINTLSSLSYDTSWMDCINENLIGLLQLQENSDLTPEELRALENAWLKKLIIRLIQLLTFL